MLTFNTNSFPENFKDIFLKAFTSGPIRSMPCNKMPALPKKKKGTIVLGDALNMRHPFTANGMTAAFCDILILRKLLSDVKDLSDYKVLSVVSKQFHKLRRNHSFVINVLANFLHKICYANDGKKLLFNLFKSLFYSLNCLFRVDDDASKSIYQFYKS